DRPAAWDLCRKIYDAVEYAPNVSQVPTVAYSGADDPQKAAADNIEARLKRLDIPMTHLIAPGVKHVFVPEYQKKADALWSKYAAAGREPYPPEVRFVTW